MERRPKRLLWTLPLALLVLVGAGFLLFSQFADAPFSRAAGPTETVPGAMSLSIQGYDAAASEDGAGTNTCSDTIDNDGSNAAPDGMRADIYDTDCQVPIGPSACSDASNPTQCVLDLSEAFVVIVKIDEIPYNSQAKEDTILGQFTCGDGIDNGPNNDGLGTDGADSKDADLDCTGYIAVQSFLDFGNYDPAASEDGAGPNTCDNGIDDGNVGGEDRTDPDCVVLDLTYPVAKQVGAAQQFDAAKDCRALALGGGDPASVGLVAHACTDGSIIAPVRDDYVGRFVTMALNCSAAPSVTEIKLVPAVPFVFESGAGFGQQGADGVTTIFPASDSLTISCGQAAGETDTPTPTITPGGPTLTPTSTVTPTPIGVSTDTPTPTHTVMVTNTPTNTPTITNTPTFGLDASPTATPTTPPSLALGDVTGDGVVNSSDALWLLWFEAALVVAVPFSGVADLNGDGQLTSSDALLILQLEAGLIILVPPPVAAIEGLFWHWLGWR